MTQATRTTRRRTSAKPAADNSVQTAIAELLRAETEQDTSQAEATPEPEIEIVEPEIEPEIEIETEAPVETEAACVEASVQPQPALVSETAIETVSEPAQLATLPDGESPAVANNILRAYKMAFRASNLVVSCDGGKTNEDSGLTHVQGLPCDMALYISEAASPDYEFDFRFRLAFMADDGVMSELNLNACNTARDGSIYVTGPVRSLLAALISIEHDEDDLRAFCEGARFRMRPGDASKSKTGRATVFLNTDIAVGDRWMELETRSLWAQAPGTAPQLIDTVRRLKAAFRNAGMMLPGAAVVGAELIEGAEVLA